MITTKGFGQKMRREFFRSEVNFKCIDCYKDTLPDPNCFTIHDDLWLSICPGYVGDLCLRCLRIRLKRGLELSDFQIELDVNNHITQELLNEVNS